MSSQACAYVASKSDPESWHGAESSTFHLDKVPARGGLGIEEWQCPHPPLERDDEGDNDDNQYCVFHTDPPNVPDDIDECEALLDAIQDAGDGPWSDRPEHRGQFVGATFGTIDLSAETITATDYHDIRFDHARFQANNENLNFRETTFVTKGRHPISFAGTQFITTGEGDVAFRNATFQANGKGDVAFPDVTFQTRSEGRVLFTGATFRTDDQGEVTFPDATFQTDGEGDILFPGATFLTVGEGDLLFDDAKFRTDGKGSVVFQGVTFRTYGKGSVDFLNATFRAYGEGKVLFPNSMFRTDGKGHVEFSNTVFRADGEGDVKFPGATFQTDGEGDVAFSDAAFQTDGEGDVAFYSSTFRTDSGGNVTFRDTILHKADCRRIAFADANFGGVDLTEIDLREANVANISVNGATTCERLNEESDFDAEAWDATARAYHQLKTVFSEHGLVGRARNMHVRERRVRSLESKAANGWFDRRYLLSLFSRVFTGYGVQVRYLMGWMAVLFLVSTAVYVIASVEDTLAENISYSVLAFTVAPPRIPSESWVQFVMVVETFLARSQL